MTQQYKFDFSNKLFAPVNNPPTQPLDEFASIKQHDNSNPNHLEISPESALACLAKYMEVPHTSLDAFVSALRVVNANECDITRILRDVKDWDRVVELYPTAIGSFAAIARTSRIDGRGARDYWKSANSLFGLFFSYTHLGPAPELITSSSITEEVAKVLEEDPSMKDEVVEEILAEDECFEPLSKLVPAVSPKIKSWKQFFADEDTVSVFGSDTLRKLDFSRSAPTGKRYYNNVHPSIKTWPKGNEGLIRAAAGAASDLFSRPLCVFHRSKIPSKRIVRDASLFNRELYPENLVRIQEIDLEKDDPDSDEVSDPNLTSLGLASLHPDFNFAEYQQLRFEYCQKIDNLKPAEKSLEKEKFAFDHLSDYALDSLDSIRNSEPFGKYQMILHFFKPSTSSLKEILKHPDYIHIASLNEAMSVGVNSESFMCYQFDVTGYALIVPVSLFYVDHAKAWERVGEFYTPYYSPLLDDEFQDQSVKDEGGVLLHSTRVFFFDFVSPTSLGSYQDSNRAAVIVALLHRGNYFKKGVFDYSEIIEVARTTVTCDVPHLNAAADLAIYHGYTLEPVLVMNTMGSSKYKSFVVNSGLSSISKPIMMKFSSSSGDKNAVISGPQRDSSSEEDPPDQQKDVVDVTPVIDINPPDNYEEEEC